MLPIYNMSNIDRMIATIGKSKKDVVSSMHHEGLVEIKVPGKRKPAIIKDAHRIESTHISEFVYILPERAPASNILTATNAVVEFRVKAGTYYNLTKPVLQITVVESGGSASVTPTKVPFMMQLIEYMPNSQGEQMQRQTDLELWANYQWMTQEKWSTLCSQVNSTATFGAPTSVAAAGTRTYNMPIFGSFFDQADPFMPSIKGDITVRITFRNSVSAGTGTLALASQGLQLVFSNDHSSPGDRKHIEAMHMDKIWRSNFFNVCRITSTATFTAGVMTTIPLRAVTPGKAPFMLFCLRASDAVAGEAISTFSAIENAAGNSGSIGLMDADGKQVLGSSGTILASKLRYVDYADHSPSMFSQNQAIYLIPFAEDCKYAFSQCTLKHGFRYFSGDECSLQITPSTAFTTGTYVYDVLVYNVQTCDLEDRVFTWSAA